VRVRQARIQRLPPVLSSTFLNTNCGFTRNQDYRQAGGAAYMLDCSFFSKQLWQHIVEAFSMHAYCRPQVLRYAVHRVYQQRFMAPHADQAPKQHSDRAIYKHFFDYKLSV
jgi:hypothetical protein